MCVGHISSGSAREKKSEWLASTPEYNKNYGGEKKSKSIFFGSRQKKCQLVGINTMRLGVCVGREHWRLKTASTQK